MKLTWRESGDIDHLVNEARSFGASTPAREAVLRAALSVYDRAQQQAESRRAGLAPTAVRFKPDRLSDLLRAPVLTEGLDPEAETRYLLAIVALALGLSDAVGA